MELGSLKVGDLMTEPSIVSPLDSASKVIGLMEKIGAYEVFVPEQTRIGAVNIRELLKMRDPEMKVSSLSFHVPLLSRDARVENAARLMSEHRIRTLPVGENGDVSGQISARSICDAILQSKNLKLRIAQVMTSHPTVIENSDKIGKARRRSGCFEETC